MSQRETLDHLLSGRSLTELEAGDLLRAMTGGEMAPALAGGEFMAGWDGLTVGDLFERIRISMPQNSPGSLSGAQNADILAFVLASNKFPAGQTELAKDAMILKTIKFESKKSGN